MSDRRGWSFTDIYFLGKAVSSAFGFGIIVIIFSEGWVSSSNHPRPAWLAGLEYFYLFVWEVTKALVQKAFS